MPRRIMTKRSNNDAIPERDRIRSLTALTRRQSFPHLITGIGDDAAILRPPANHDLIVTTDLSLERIHFRRDWHPAASAGHRSLARGLSDLAAMGAQPLAAFLSLALPTALAGTWADHFFSGVLALANQFRIPLAGGDLARSPSPRSSLSGHALADIVLTGCVPRGQALLRSTARAGDILYVTGQIGGAALELKSLQLASLSKSSRASRSKLARPIPNSGLHPHLYPQPRVAAGIALRRLVARSPRSHISCPQVSCIDISDSLALDLSRLLEASSTPRAPLAAELDLEALPIAASATFAQALYGGEDYELLFAAPASLKIPSRLAHTQVTAIGRISRRKARDPELTLLHSTGRRQPLQPRGWQYFTD
jgi:thiamine-monophosphate kinase